MRTTAAARNPRAARPSHSDADSEVQNLDSCVLHRCVSAELLRAMGMTQHEDLKRAFVMADRSGSLLAAWEQTTCKNAQRAYKLHVRLPSSSRCVRGPKARCAGRGAGGGRHGGEV